MVKYTVDELIKVLNKFPKDLKISNDLALIWEFDENIGKAPSLKKDIHNDEFIHKTMEYATSLFILEGDWNKETVESFEKLWE